MKNKKGSVHIDWIVSMGIFLSFIVIILGFIRPGYEPRYEGDVLIDMVVEEFMERVEVNVSKTLLILGGCSTGEYQSITLKDYIPEVENEGFKVLKDGSVFGDFSGELTIKVEAGENKFWILSSEGGGYSGSVSGDSFIPADCDLTKIKAGNPIVIKGIKDSIVYGDLGVGSDWDFPEHREFRIQIRDAMGNVEDCFYSESSSTCSNVKIPDEVEVYSMNLGTKILTPNIDSDDELSLRQVIVNIEIW